jgi:hypothetical protein
MSRLMYGVGYNSKKAPVKINKKTTREHTLWTNMLRRCYSASYHIERPSYIGCSVSENFKDYSYFYHWCQNQIGFDLDNYQLDKDILEKGNKIYSEDLCLFIPAEINISLVKNKRNRGEHPIGVSFDKKSKSFRARVSNNGNCILVGYFDKPEDAFLVYKEEKEKYLRSLAFKHKNFIDVRAYRALIEYKVDITD